MSGQSFAVSHLIIITAMKEKNKIMLLKGDKTLCANYKLKKEIWKGWKKAYFPPPQQQEIRKEIK